MALILLPRVAERLLEFHFSHYIAHEYQARAVLTSAGATTAQHLELMVEGDVLEDQRLARAKRSPDQVSDELRHPGKLAGREL